MKYYDINKNQKLAAQNKEFVFGEREAGRKHFEDNFELGVKGRGKSRKSKLELQPIDLSQTAEAEEVIVIDLDSATDQNDRPGK